jgi:hypothetical protein
MLFFLCGKDWILNIIFINFGFEGIKSLLIHYRHTHNLVWTKLHNGELHNLYTSPDIDRQIKSRRMRWAGRVARMGDGRNLYRVLVGKP